MYDQNPPPQLPGSDLERPDRRVATSDRRTTPDRRSRQERRHDDRLAPVKPHKPLKAWIRSLVHARLGVDRRKQAERRSNPDRRQPPRSLLTREELADLLSSE